ncbi:MAG: hypothetical protein HQK75_08750 [Candidatus Magnetomorum sp.]|nr:hypothetical protein [Candidatus Magnetomorum sp.]
MNDYSTGINDSSVDLVTEEILSKDLKTLEQKVLPLRKQNQKYKEQMAILTEDISQMDQSIEFLKGAIEDSENKKASALNEIGSFQLKNEHLISDINKIKSMIKATVSDKENTSRLIENLTNELNDFKSEKDIAIDRIKKMKEAIKTISCEKDRKLPKLKRYDALLKSAYNTFQETENRMDLSLKLRKVFHHAESSTDNN